MSKKKINLIENKNSDSSNLDFEIVKYLYDKEIEREKQIENSATPISIIGSLAEIVTMYNFDALCLLLKQKGWLIFFCVVISLSLLFSFAPKIFSSKINQTSQNSDLQKFDLKTVEDCLQYLHKSNNTKVAIIWASYFLFVLWTGILVITLVIAK